MVRDARTGDGRHVATRMRARSWNRGYRDRAMTDQQTPVPTLDRPADEQSQRDVVAEAVSVIDVALAQMMQRELVSSGEVADLLLDVRTLLTR
jgi:hypothetical protein